MLRRNYSYVDNNKIVITEEQANELFVRFMLNSPTKSFANPQDFCILLENAFYFYCDQMNNSIPIKFNTDNVLFQRMCDALFSRIPELRVLKSYSYSLFDIHREHYSNAENAGCICINKNLTHVLVVHQHANERVFAFPKGKMCKGESYIEAGIREMLEETGIDVSNVIRAEDKISMTRGSNKSKVNFFIVVLDMPITTHLETPSELEVASIRWASIAEIHDRAEKYLRLRAQGKNKAIKSGPDYMTMMLSQKIQNWIDNYKNKYL